MISEPPHPKVGDKMCSISNKEKSKHLAEEMLACSRKIQESQKQDRDKSQ